MDMVILGKRLGLGNGVNCHGMISCSFVISLLHFSSLSTEQISGEVRLIWD
jgi:hypothetical protein